MNRSGLFWLLSCIGYLVTGYFFLWSVAAAELRFLRCPGGYSVFAVNAECRLPAILQVSWLLLLGLSLTLTVLALRPSLGHKPPKPDASQ